MAKNDPLFRPFDTSGTPGQDGGWALLVRDGVLFFEAGTSKVDAEALARDLNAAVQREIGAERDRACRIIDEEHCDHPANIERMKARIREGD